MEFIISFSIVFLVAGLAFYGLYKCSKPDTKKIEEKPITNIKKPNKDLIILNGLYFGANYKKDAIKYSDCVKRLILEILVCIDKPDYDYNYLYIDITSTPTLDEDIFLHLVKADLIRCEKITIPVKKDRYGFIERRARTYLLIGITKKGREFAYQ